MSIKVDLLNVNCGGASADRVALAVSIVTQPPQFKWTTLLGFTNAIRKNNKGLWEGGYRQWSTRKARVETDLSAADSNGGGRGQK